MRAAIPVLSILSFFVSTAAGAILDVQPSMCLRGCALQDGLRWAVRLEGLALLNANRLQLVDYRFVSNEPRLALDETVES